MNRTLVLAALLLAPPALGPLNPAVAADVSTRDADEVLGRPRDVRFAIDRADAWNRTHDILRGRLDLDRVGMMGQSFGAFSLKPFLRGGVTGVEVLAK